MHNIVLAFYLYINILTESAHNVIVQFDKFPQTEYVYIIGHVPKSTPLAPFLY